MNRVRPGTLWWNLDSSRAEMSDLFDDDLLMQRVHEGDLTFMGYLFERHSAAVYSFFVNTTGDRQASEDLTQDVFMRLIQYRNSYHPGRPFRPWLYQTARHLLFDYRRSVSARLRRERSLTSDFPDDGLEASGTIAAAVVPSVHRETAYSPADVLEEAEGRRALDRALDALSSEDRELLILSFVADLSYAEIARVFDITVNAARVRAFRAIRRLRQSYPESDAAGS